MAAPGASDRVLALAPHVAWNAWESGNQSLNFTVNDASGNATTVNKTFAIDFLLPTFQAADAVIGQGDFTGTPADCGGTAAAPTLDPPWGSQRYIKSMLRWPDYANNPMPGFDGTQAANGTAMSYVAGKGDFVSTAPGRGDMTVTGPRQLLFHNGHYYLRDYDNDRVSGGNTLGVPFRSTEDNQKCAP